MEKILVVIDMQNDFIDGALGTSEAQAIVDNVVAKIKSYDKENVYGTADTHTEDYMNTQEGKKLPVPHCIFKHEGWKLHPKIEPLVEKTQFFIKPTFGSIKLAEELKKLYNYYKEMEIEIVGLCTDICVVSNALMLKAYMPEVKITVDSSCCAGVTPESHEAALKTMEMCQIEII